MRNTMSSIGHGSPAVLDRTKHGQGDLALGLEALPPGKRFVARDGCKFIRTNLICFGFCDLSTGQLCSARDICALHGGASLQVMAASAQRAGYRSGPNG